MQPEKPTNNKPFVFSKFPLYANELPLFREQKNKKWIRYGQQNDYPDYLGYLFNNSGVHNAIVSGKAMYIAGKGFQVKKNVTGTQKLQAEAILKSINEYQTINELLNQSVLDRVIYGSYAFKVKWAKGKIASIKLQPINTIRTNESRTEFYISNEWTRDMSIKDRWYKFNNEPIDVHTLLAFDSTNPTGEQILYISDYRPQMKVYALPEYIGCVTSIETDIECPNYHLNEIKSGFSAGTMITLFNGQPQEEEKLEVDRELKRKFSNSDNAGEIVLNFQNAGTTPPMVTPLNGNDLDKRYEQLQKDTVDKIFIGHRISSPMLFGLKTAGELGGRSELQIAWEHFTNTYVKPKQQIVEDDFNYMLKFISPELEGTIEIINLEPIGIEISMDMINEVLTFEEKRKLVLEKLSIEEAKPQVEMQMAETYNDYPEAAKKNAQRALDIKQENDLGCGTPVGWTRANQLAQGENISRDTIARMSSFERHRENSKGNPKDDCGALMWLAWGGDEGVAWATKKLQQIDKTKLSAHYFKDEDINSILINKFKAIGVNESDYEIVSEHENIPYEFAEQTVNEKVIEILKENEKISVKAIAELLDISESKLIKIIEDLQLNNKVNVKYIEGAAGIEIITENINEPKAVGLTTMWRYSGPQDSKNREFCADMLELKKLYTRAEIEKLNNDMETYNTNVWKYKGGWYHNPSTGVNEPQCRHTWKQIIVKRK
jgi:hypothetical protein